MRTPLLKYFNLSLNLFTLATFRVIEGNTSVSQDQGKLKSIQVNKEFELYGSRDTKVFYIQVLSVSQQCNGASTLSLLCGT